MTPGNGKHDLAYWTNTITLGGGEAMDVLIDTTNVAPGTYFLYTTNLNYLTNDGEDFGGIMAEITVLPARTAPSAPALAAGRTGVPSGAAKISRASALSPNLEAAGTRQERRLP